MKSCDFEYDGYLLSDMGFVVCKFGSDGIETVTNGSSITFNTVSTMRGAKHELLSTEYAECLTAIFQICKHPCASDGEVVSVEEARNIMRWLNRKEYHKLKLLDYEYSDIYFEASFNVSKIESDGKIYGFELEMFTNRPYALHDPIPVMINATEKNSIGQVRSKSDEEGYIYPEMEITIKQDGDFELYNAFEGRTMRIANCKTNEVIKVKYPMIESSLKTHRINNDFNWNFFRISSSFKNKLNELTISIPCSIKLEYSPIVKIGI